MLEGWTNVEKINRMIEYVSKIKHYKAIFMFKNASMLLEIAPKLVSSDYHQTCLSDRANNVCYQTLKILKKHELANLTPEHSKILKMMSADHVSRMLKGLIDPTYKSTSFCYRLLELLNKKNPKLSTSDLILFALDFFYSSTDPRDRAFLKEARKIFKT